MTDLSDKENDNYIKVNESRGPQKRHIIYSSNSENEDNPSNNYYKTKGNATKGLPAKKTKRQDSPKYADANYCIECFDNYKNTMSKSDWIQCIMCQKWLHEMCTLFRNYCSRCGKLKALTSST